MNVVNNVVFNDYLKDVTLFNPYLRCLKSKKRLLSDKENRRYEVEPN